MNKHARVNEFNNGSLKFRGVEWAMHVCDTFLKWAIKNLYKYSTKNEAATRQQ